MKLLIIDLTLRKAKKGEMRAGHKYRSRTWDAQAGAWVYDYGASASGGHKHVAQSDMFGLGDTSEAASPALRAAERPAPAPAPAPKAPSKRRTYQQRTYKWGSAIRLPAAERSALWSEHGDDVRGAHPSGHGGTHYTDKQIDQMVDLVELWAEGWRGSKISEASLSPAVRDFGLSFGLIGYGKTTGPYDPKVTDVNSLYVEGAYQSKPDTRYSHEGIRNQMQFEPSAYLPPEALWRMVDKHILRGRDHAGRSLAKDPGWKKFDITPEGGTGHVSADMDRIMKILIQLQTHGYLIAQFGGNVWSIETAKEYRAS